jgi:hypothetical protein
MPAWVSEVGVAATVIGVATGVAVAILAIWGERVRAAFLKPKLRLRLRGDKGELFAGGLSDPSVEPGRYYHLLVTNEARFPAAHEVVVFLTRLEKRGPDGEPQTVYNTDLPLSWMFPQLYDDRRRTIGSTTVAISDLFVAHPTRLKLLPLLAPSNLPDTFQPDAHFWVTVVARGINGQSNYLRLRVNWNGQWHLGQTEMANHLKITLA